MMSIKAFINKMVIKRRKSRADKKFEKFMKEIQNPANIRKFERKDRRRMQSHPHEYNWN